MVNMPTLDEASSALKDADGFRSAFCRLAHEYGLEESVGLALIHQHDNCDQGMVLIEVPDGPNAFRLHALPQERAWGHATPSVWRVQGDCLVATQGCGCHSPP